MATFLVMENVFSKLKASVMPTSGWYEKREGASEAGLMLIVALVALVVLVVDMATSFRFSYFLSVRRNYL